MLISWAPPALAQALASEEPSLDEIVVTAQKRGENLQRVPIAITAITADRLERQPSMNSGEIGHYVPGLLIGKSLVGGQTYFRGVGQSVGLPGAESPIATYLDGIYLASPAVAVFELNNVDQVAVLKGPQGTLFGRNATGGVIQVTTREPSPRFGARFDLGYGRFDTLTARAYLTGAVAPDLASSLSFVGKRRANGYVRNLVTGHALLDEKSWSAQNRWLWKPVDGLRIDLNLIHGDYRNLSGSTAGVFPGYLAADGITPYLGYRTVSNRNDPINSTHSTIASLKTALDRDWARISNQLSYTAFQGHAVVDLSASPGLPNPNGVPATTSDVRARIATLSNEFQIQSPDASRIQWIGGLFYLHNMTRIRAATFIDAATVTAFRTRLTVNSIALFGQAIAPLTDDTRLTLGLRYTDDKVRLRGTSVPATPPAALGPDRKHWQRLTWRAAIDHSFTPATMGYLSYNRGFKGGVFTNSALSFPPSNPETIDAYEAGLKTELSGGRVRINSAGFYYDYRNIQLRTIRGGQVLVYNAAKSRMYGGEIELDALLTGAVKLTAGAQYLHARYHTFPSGVRNDPTPLLAVPAGCAGAPLPRTGGTARLICDLSGNRMIKAPTFSANIGLTYTHEMRSGRISVTLQDSYSSRYYFEPDNRLSQPSYHFIDASVRWVSSDDRWRITLWGSNLANEHVFESAVTGASTYLYAPGTPVTYGITIGTSL